MVGRHSPVGDRDAMPALARGRSAARLRETRLVGEHDHLHSVAKIELLENVRDVGLDGRLAEMSRPATPHDRVMGSAGVEEGPPPGTLANRELADGVSPPSRRALRRGDGAAQRSTGEGARVPSPGGTAVAGANNASTGGSGRDAGARLGTLAASWTPIDELRRQIRWLRSSPGANAVTGARV